jgi:protein-S-isoprenylcysteine O-methyltransferase Ste14
VRPVEALARRRVTLGFLAGAVVLWQAHPTRMTLLIGVAVAALGEAFRFWAAGHLNKAREVTSSGPYRWCAHPLYVGSSVMGIGLAIASGSLLVAGLIVAYLAVTLTAAIRGEEAFLRGKFGQGYDVYRQGARRDDSRRFSLAQAMANREHRAVAGLVLAALLLALRASRGV